MLTAFSEALQNYLSDFGIARRFGGDEFLFINFRDLTYDENKRSASNRSAHHRSCAEHSKYRIMRFLSRVPPDLPDSRRTLIIMKIFSD